jgi:hypothetical protein
MCWPVRRGRGRLARQVGYGAPNPQSDFLSRETWGEPHCADQSVSVFIMPWLYRKPAAVAKAGVRPHTYTISHGHKSLSTTHFMLAPAAYAVPRWSL